MLDGVLVQHPHACGDGAHGQLLVARHAQFAHQEHHPGCAERPSYLVADGNAAAGQRQDKQIPAVGVLLQVLRKLPTDIQAVLEKHRQNLRRDCVQAACGILSPVGLDLRVVRGSRSA